MKIRWVREISHYQPSNLTWPNVWQTVEIGISVETQLRCSSAIV